MTALGITYTCQKCKLYPKLRIGLAKKYSRIFYRFPWPGLSLHRGGREVETLHQD